ncbi:MAG: polysaccharide deacetylase, partial [Lachnospiraceae bacterium]|nr:polysaccharide deacetylase [Lachnospiraceae bacterium]
MSWEGKLKAVTFSYDDGVEQDRRLVELFNRYGVKATFNLNSGIQTGANFWESNGTVIRRMNIKGLKELYRGHEIAVHTLTHANLDPCTDETIFNEIWQDKCNLERLFDTDVCGMAYPYGVYSDRTVKVAEECGIRYARTVEATGDFQIPTDLLRLKATGHHNDREMLRLAKEFV